MALYDPSEGCLPFAPEPYIPAAVCLECISRSKHCEELLVVVASPALVFQGKGIVELYPGREPFVVAVFNFKVGIQKPFQLGNIG